jgi:hypothetical protein
MELKKKLLGLLTVLGLLAALMLSVNLIGNALDKALNPPPDVQERKIAEELSKLESELRRMPWTAETYEEYDSKVSEWNELREELLKIPNRRLPVPEIRFRRMSKQEYCSHENKYPKYYSPPDFKRFKPVEPPYSTGR